MAIKDPSEIELTGSKSEAEIFYEFLRYLENKPDDDVFNVPRGKLDRVERSKVKYFLGVKGDNK
mgnify:CR=1 FL=1